MYTTEEEKRKSIVTELDKSFFVEAGAGAGKTRLIVDRITQQLKSGIRPEEIVAITFTNAAARELKDRIFESVQKEFAGGGLGENAKEIMDSLDRMHISTIHGFCNRILSERCFDAGLPIGFELLSEKDKEEIFNGLFVEWTEKSMVGSDWEKLRTVFEDRRTAWKSLKELTGRIYELPDDVELKVVMDPEKWEQVRQETESYFRDLISRLDQLTVNHKLVYSSIDDLNKNSEKSPVYGKTKEVLNYLEQKAYGDALSSVLEIKEQAKGIFITKGKGDITKLDWFQSQIQGLKGDEKKEKTNELFEEYNEERIEEEREVFDEFIENKRPYLEGLKDFLKAGETNPKIETMLELAKRAAAFCREHYPKNCVSNDMLLQKTYEFLLKSNEVRDFFADKFKCYYVDEYQDTDHIQAGFIKLLVQKTDREEDGIRDGSLFLVGDPKQSIYRFRGAEPEVYFETKKWMETLVPLGKVNVFELSYNYRSDPSVIEWVNKQFQNKNITEGFPYVPMEAKNKFLGKKPPYDKSVIKGIYRYGESREQEDEDANAVCDFIINAMKKYSIEDDTKERGGKPRPIRYSDFLLLCANNPGGDAYSKRMKEVGIPFTLYGKMEMHKKYYLKAFVRLYAFLIQPYDYFAVTGAKEVLTFSGAEDEEKNDKILEQLRKDTRDLSGYGCLKYLMNHPELILKKNNEALDELKREEIQKMLVQMTESVMMSQHEGKRQILQDLKDYMMTELERELALEENPDAVRFMNIHKAKGLEGNIVIWLNRIEERRFKLDKFQCNTEDGRVLYPKVDNLGVGYCGDMELFEKAKTAHDCELVRLEYVAATRAKQALIFMDIVKNTKSPMFAPSGYDLKDLPSIKDIVNDTAETGEGGEDATEWPIEFPVSGEDSLAGRLYSSESPSDYERKGFGKKDKQSTDTDLAEPDESAEEPDEFSAESDAPNDPSGEAAEPMFPEPRPKGNILGTAMHRSFQLLIDRMKQGSFQAAGIDERKLLEICVNQALNEDTEDIPLSEFEHYGKFLMQAIMKLKNWLEREQILENAEDVYTEYTFSYMKKDAGAENGIPVWMHGEADLIVKNRDGSFALYDYKSDSDENLKNYPTEEVFVEKLKFTYTPQIRAYREAISELFGTQPDRIHAELISFSRRDTAEGEYLRIRFTPIEIE